MIPTQQQILPKPRSFKVRFPIGLGKYHLFIATLAVFFCGSSVSAADGWQSLFNGKDLTGWRANAYPESFTVENGAIRANATTESSHLFYVGDLKEGAVRFKNFEFEAAVRSEKESNSGIYFHSDINSGKGPQMHHRAGECPASTRVCRSLARSGGRGHRVARTRSEEFLLVQGYSHPTAAMSRNRCLKR